MRATRRIICPQMAALSKEWVQQLAARRRECQVPAPLRPQAREFIDELMSVLFPHFGSPRAPSVDAVEAEVVALGDRLAALEQTLAPYFENGQALSDLKGRFFEQLPRVCSLMDQDAQAIFSGDPAAQSLDEVILCYPGFWAIAVYRVAHVLGQLNVPLLPRLLTEYAHEKTGIDIHPGATIGHSFFIDHGTGVVIGETTVIGNRVKIYQGVTLGALNVTKSLAHSKRHPTLEDDVVIYAGATILGGQTVVGHDSVVAGNAWLTQSVPPFSLVSRRSEVRSRHDALPDAIDFQI